ncbi:MAG: RDD family protein [Syntrophales bacterium]
MAEDSYGGFWRRAMAFSIDKIILFFTSLFILFIGMLALSISFLSHYRDMLPERFEEMSITFVLVYLLMTVFISMFYFTYFHGAAGQTPGKMIFGLKVVQSKGEQVTFGLAFLRWVGYIISAVVFYFGFVWIAFDAKKQGWHDKIAETVVIRIRNVVDGPAYEPDEKGLDKEGDFL